MIHRKNTRSRRDPRAGQPADPAVDMPAERERADPIAALRSRIQSARARLEKFVLDLKSDPHHAMEWSSSAFAAAADLHVYGLIANAIKCGCDDETKAATADQVAHFCQEELNRQAGCPERSIGPSMMLAQEKLRAWAAAVEILRWASWSAADDRASDPGASGCTRAVPAVVEVSGMVPAASRADARKRRRA